MKRIRFGEQGEFTDSINLANVLMLLAAGGTKNHNSTPSSPPRVFECKTCSRQFPSFQALGGHRASHKKPMQEDGPGQLTLGKPKMHKCPICGLGFAIGQALGGHMRRHRANSEGFGRRDMAEKNSWGGKRVLSLDLNFPPLDETEVRLKEIGLGLGLKMVDYFK